VACNEDIKHEEGKEKEEEKRSLVGKVFCVFGLLPKSG
jgi:hypothetical protein